MKTMEPVLARLCEGVERIHDDGARLLFLREVGGRLDEVKEWVVEAGLEGKVNADYTPTFMHGGSSVGKWIVMGINPGADDYLEEHEFKRKSPDQFVAFHERFFELFPTLRPNGKQRWWTKCYRVTRVLVGVISGVVERVPWQDLQANSLFVSQDLIPLHGRSSGTLTAADFQKGPIAELADGAIRGLERSQARGVLVCSRFGYGFFGAHPRVDVERRFVLTGSTHTGKPRRVEGFVARVGHVPVVALDNEVMAQPSFPYEQLLPGLLAELKRDGLA
jgi:hypothetical protein